MAGLQEFVDAYRSVLPYDPTGTNHAARLTIDLGAGDRWLTAITRYATANWLDTTSPVLDYANAMVAGTSSGAPSDWQEHIDGKPNYAPPVPPLAPAKLTGGSDVAHGRTPRRSAQTSPASVQKADATYVQTVAPTAPDDGRDARLHVLGGGAPVGATRLYGTSPPNTCEGGMGVAATTFAIGIPMPALRQQ